MLYSTRAGTQNRAALLALTTKFPLATSNFFCQQTYLTGFISAQVTSGLLLLHPLLNKTLFRGSKQL